MKKSRNKQQDTTLRQKAEEKLQKKELNTNLPSDYADADTKKLIYNLEVHQIELEMQQQEILSAKELSELAAEKYAELYDFSPTAYFTISKDGSILELNLSGAKMLCKQRGDFKNKPFNFFVAESNRHGFSLFLHLVFESKKEQTINLIITANEQRHIHVRLTGIVAKNGQQCLLTVLDITTEWYYDELEKLERAVLVMNVSGINNMQEVLHTYMVGLEKLHKGIHCCLLEIRGDKLFNLASPSIPQNYLALIEGIHVDSTTSPCRSIAILNEKIQLHDIENDSCPTEFKAMATQHQLKACYSYPLCNKKGEVVAVFCVYFNHIKMAYATDEYAIEKAWHILQILLQNFYKAAEIKASEDKYRQLINDVQVGVILQSATADIIMSNPEALNLLGLDENQLLGKTSFDKDWNVIHEDGTDFPGNMHPVAQAIATLLPVRKVVMGVYRPAYKDRIWLLVDAVPQLQEDGNIRQVVCSFTNITNLLATQKSLEQSKLLLRQTEQLGNIGGWELDVATLQQTWTEETFNIFELDTTNGAPVVPEGLNFFTAGCRPLVAEKLQRAVEFGEPYNEVWEIITTKGNRKWVHAVAKAAQKNSQVIKVSGFYQDISDRKKAELELKESEFKYRSLFNNLDAGIVIHSADTAITNCNPKAVALLGLSLGQLTGKLAIDAAWHFMYEDKTPVPIDKYPVNQILKSGEPVKNLIIGVNRPATNDVVWLMGNGFPVMDSNGCIREIVVSFVDITEQKLAEENLRHSNAELEQFAYSASHDLQEPLRMVTGFLSLIEKKYADALDDNGKSYINYAADGAKRMQQLIQDLLEFARIGKTINNLETININGLIAEIELLCQHRIADKNALIEVPVKLPIIQAYKAPIRQVFLNLISNALTYNRVNVQLKIIIEARDTNDYWQFSVTDNGIGIAKNNFDKIFEIFKRLHTKEEYSGTGIGLAITKKVVELHGGKIWVESEEGFGSTFNFTIKK